MLLYILQNTVLTEVAYFSQVNYLASYLDLNVGGTSAASTSQVAMSTRTVTDYRELGHAVFGCPTVTQCSHKVSTNFVNQKMKWGTHSTDINIASFFFFFNRKGDMLRRNIRIEC